MVPTKEELEYRTREFWVLALACAGRWKQGVTVSDAIALCNDHLKHLNPGRPLSTRVFNLQTVIIEGRTKRVKPKKDNVKQLCSSK